ncbi:MAG: hypothetical protein LUH12_10345 [Bacteroides sp.]|nr:hypothetical protein [Bacteroides sp.]
MKKKEYRKTGWLLLLLFSLYWCGITLFTHSHVVNGVVIVHSHPFHTGHAHTGVQYETILYLSAIVSSGNESTSVDLPLWLILLAVLIANPTGGKPVLREIRSYHLRAPPSRL